MPVIINKDSNEFISNIQGIARKTFLVGLIPAIGILCYLIYGLLTNQLSDTGGNSARAVQIIQQLSLWLNIALVVTVISGLFLYYDEDWFGFTLLAVAALLAFGIRYLIDFLFAADSASMTVGKAAQALFGEFRVASMIIAAPGVLLVLRSMFMRIFFGKNQDLTKVTYGKEVQKQTDRPNRALIGMFAACWQLPFCRDGIRVKCPIFHARTKCWKQRVGCMCEENIIIMAMGDNPSDGGTKTEQMPAGGGGFVPIGDLLKENVQKTRATIPTRPGPRGVRIPTNPHLTETQKRQRCHNCVIYNEHQRQKYQFLSGPLTLAVPALVFWKFDELRQGYTDIIERLGVLFAKLSFTGQSSASDTVQNLSGNFFVETVFIICMTLVLMTLTLRALEYACFKLKI